MYERFYHLRERPFALTPDPDYLYPSRVHKEALSYLRYGIESHAGFIVITGAIGSGKTTLLQTMMRGLDGQTTVARLMNTLLDPRELLESAMIDLGLDPADKSKPALLKQLGEFLVEERTSGRLVLLVIDEAQNLSLASLEEIRMLSNLETEKSKLIQIILIGQPDLRDKLGRPELEQLRQRITVSYHLEALDAEETAHYVNHRLARASIGTPLEFPVDVTDRIHARSGGVPRLINVIADATLVFGYGEERSEIDCALVEEVIADLDATGVLGVRTAPEAPRVPADSPSIDPARLNSENAAAAARLRPEAMAARIAEGDARARQLADREKQVRQREREMESRERELAEQRRVLAEQYRLLRAQAAHAPSTTAAAAPAWPPTQTAAAAAPPSSTTATPAVGSAAIGRRAHIPVSASASFRSKRPGFWRRVKTTLLGSPETVLEDSL
jgi:general secretion pathway protein A